MSRYNRNNAVLASLACITAGALLSFPQTVSGRATIPAYEGRHAAAHSFTAPSEEVYISLKLGEPVSPSRASAAQSEFAYGGVTFTEFIKTSYADGGDASLPDFYAWFAKAYGRSGVTYPGLPKGSLDATLNGIAARYKAAPTPEAKAKVERQAGAWAHRAIKRAIPKFSLDRGFEFRYAVTRGERQCFLQSVLLSGLLQKAGMDAGVVMVSKNEKGQETNNGHAVSLMKLSNGRDLVIDVSHPEPVAKQQGLFVATDSGNYRYVSPVFASDGAITGYTTPDGGSLPAASVAGLDNNFLRSQFDYYRGERTVGGLLSQPNPAGLHKEAFYLQRAVAECPQNPLAVYMLGRTYLRMGQTEKARRQILAAHQTYMRAGWVPQGARDALAMVNRAPRTVTMR